MRKDQIRKAVLALREAQSESSKKQKDAAITKKLKAFRPFKKTKEFFSYLAHRGEVSTDQLILDYFGKKKIILPKLRRKQICLFELTHPARFVKGKFGIREPELRLPHTSLNGIEVALIPGIVFDVTGHRIGYGGGYFDRFLKKVRCTTIGLAYEFQIIEKIETHSYDVPVDYILTEKRIITCAHNRPKSVSQTKLVRQRKNRQ